MRISDWSSDLCSSDLYGEAARRAQAELHVLVEIDVGAARCGVAPGADAVELAKLIADTPGLSFEGLQAYHGSAQHIRGFRERRAAIRNAAQAVQVTAEKRSAERRVGKECVSTCIHRWSPVP